MINTQEIENDIMTRIEAMAETRRISNRKENQVMLAYLIAVVVALSLMIYLFKKDKLRALLSEFHIEINTGGAFQWSLYYPLIAIAAGLSLIAFIGYALSRKQMIPEQQVL